MLNEQCFLPLILSPLPAVLTLLFSLISSSPLHFFLFLHFFLCLTPFISDFLVMLGTIKDGVLTIGKVSAPVYSPNEKMKVPDVLFYENTQVSLSAHHYHCVAFSSSAAAHSTGLQTPYCHHNLLLLSY